MDAGSYVQPVLKLGITPWNPQTGLMVAFLCLHPRSAGWVLVALTLAELLVRGMPSNPVIFLVQAVIVTTTYLMAAVTIRRFEFDISKPTFAALTRFSCIAALAAFVASSSVVGLYATASLLPGGQFGSAVGKLWVGDLNGILMLTPLLLKTPTIRKSLRPINLAPAKFLGVSAALMVSFLIVFFIGDPDDLRFFYVLFVPAVLAALVGGVSGVLVVAVVIQIGLAFGVQQLPEVAPLVDLQYLMLTLVGTTLALGVVVAERANTSEIALQREIQLRDREASLARASRAATAGELASVIAHELNQPMTALVGYLRSIEIMLVNSPVTESRLRPTARKAADEALRVSDTLYRLRNFYAGRDPHIETLEFRPLILGIADLLRRRERIGNASIDVKFKTDIEQIESDSVFISVIISNLVLNSAEALRDTTAPKIEILVKENAESLEISIEDNGSGVPERLIPELFKAFVTTKTEGMGMGLAASHSLSQALRGDLLYARSELGGAKFTLILPLRSGQ